MEIIDAHTHTEFRSANDYWDMALAGVKIIIDPSTFGGIKKSTKELYYATFERLLNFEVWRAKRNGITLYAGVGVDPEDFTDLNVALEVIEAIPQRYFEHKNLCCLGEIGLDKGGRDEEIVFTKQLEIVGSYNIPAVIHTPQVNQSKIVDRTISIVDEYTKIYPNLKQYLLLDELLPEVLLEVSQTGFAFYGIPVGPYLNSPFIVHRKTTGKALLDIIPHIDTKKIVVNSALAWGYGDHLALPKIKLYLEQENVANDIIENLFCNNACEFYSKWKTL